MQHPPEHPLNSKTNGTHPGSWWSLSVGCENRFEVQERCWLLVAVALCIMKLLSEHYHCGQRLGPKCRKQIDGMCNEHPTSVQLVNNEPNNSTANFGRQELRNTSHSWFYVLYLHCSSNKRSQHVGLLLCKGVKGILHPRCGSVQTLQWKDV